MNEETIGLAFTVGIMVFVLGVLSQRNTKDVNMEDESCPYCVRGKVDGVNCQICYGTGWKQELGKETNV